MAPQKDLDIFFFLSVLKLFLTQFHPALWIRIILMPFRINLSKLMWINDT